MPVLDIVPEGCKPDLAGFEPRLGCAQEPHGVIDDAQRPQRRGAIGKSGPNAERLERGHRARKQGGGAIVGAGGLRHQDGFPAGAGKRERRGQARCTRSDNRNLGR